jgi:nitrite reductase (NADH) small subunit
LKQLELCRVSELPLNEPQLVSNGRFKATAVRTEDAVHVFSAVCPHRGAPLHRGEVRVRVDSTGPGSMTTNESELLLLCPWHKWEFSVETGAALLDRDRCLRRYRTEVVNDVLTVFPRERP